MSEQLEELELELDDEDEEEEEADDEDDDDATELSSSSDESINPVTAFMSQILCDSLTQSDRSKMYTKTVVAHKKPMQTEAVRPLRSRNNP
mmetsp:Transcript_6917/g.15097  ORF Transcript_6917/g.15097 Transcript_6917/m.15097 type:complete len:91 (+) Transcript_6917:135-407(+)